MLPSTNRSPKMTISSDIKDTLDIASVFADEFNPRVLTGTAIKACEEWLAKQKADLIKSFVPGSKVQFDQYRGTVTGHVVSISKDDFVLIHCDNDAKYWVSPFDIKKIGDIVK